MRLDLGPTLDELRAQMSARVDAEAEAARQRWITPGAGQAMEYQATQAEADAYLAAHASPGGVPAGAAWPWLTAEQEARGPGMTLLELAQEVAALRNAWVVAGSQIKALRRAAKIAIQAATTPAEIRAAAQVNWPLP